MHPGSCVEDSMASDPMRAVRSVLCASDFSPTAGLALDHAEALARRHRAKLVLAHVVEPWPTTLYPPLSVPDDSERLMRDAATQRLRALAGPLTASGLEIETRVVTGAPGREIVELARALGSDAIVLGTHGRTGPAHVLFGSTAEHVVRRSPVPVLTVHPRDRKPGDRIARIVVPTDLSRGAEEAVEALGRLFPAQVPAQAPTPAPTPVAARPSAPAVRIVLVHVDELARYFEPYGEEVVPGAFSAEARRVEVDHALADAAEGLRRAGFEVDPRVISTGTPARVVCDLARSEQADLIVLGTHGHSALLNLLMGRTAQRIVQHAPCPVLTVRASDRPVPPA